ncbi:PQQ-binding-like beta-propeller repeat protein [Endozoicomonas arenosclerae]|uniref:PQQ-binding-like beta-propeller repeat protein n=1 Tax=Endozoicomonas arenosclerae TaxID=1633495 RepID=UPI000ADC35B3|nr:PQQ-binding-like beta-propeller repeat protein [Endozoicomonas arenosclerae]
MKKKLLALAVLAASSSVMASDTMIETPRAGVYADTEWATAHGGPRNDDYISSIQELPRYYEQSAEVLEGAAVLLGPTRGPNGDFYASTALGKGHSNLTAFDGEGNIKWQTPPWQGADDFDPGGVIAAPAVDKDGNVYISDANQMWSFDEDGEVRWVTPLPKPTVDVEGVFDELNLGMEANSITNPFFTMPVNGDESTAYVGGITMFGDVMIFDRKTGEIVAGPVNMPGEFETHVLSPAPGAMSEPYVAEGWGSVIWTYFHGGVESANVPAVHPETGMIYATGTSSKNYGDGAVHGFTFGPETKKIEFVYEAQMGPGSGSSPAISSDLKYMYASDADATLYKFRTDSDKEPVWTTDVAGRPASASLGGPGDDKIYVYDERYVYAVNPETKEVDWDIDMLEFAKEMLPAGPIDDPQICDFSGFHNGIVVSTANELLITGVLGYNYALGGGCPTADSGEGVAQTEGGGMVIPTAQIQGVWAVDPKTGDILRDGQMIPAEDTNEAFTVPTTDGYLLMDRGVLSSGINKTFYPLTQSKFGDDNKPILPQGGIEVLQGQDDIKITAAISGRVMFDEAFAKQDSTLRLERKGSSNNKELKGQAEGQNDISYEVDVKSVGNGKSLKGDIEVKEGKKTVHKIEIAHGSFKDRSVEGVGVDKKTGKKVNFYIADWRASGEKGDK